MAKVDSPDSTRVEVKGSVVEGAEEKPNKKFALLNYGNGEEINKLENNLIDIAVPLLTVKSKDRSDSVIPQEAKLLFCYNLRNLGELTSRGVEDERIWRNVECDEIQGDWVYGVVFGRYYGVSFIVAKGSEYEGVMKECDIVEKGFCNLDQSGLNNSNLWKELVLIADSDKRFDKGDWKGSWKELKRAESTPKSKFIIGKKFYIKDGLSGDGDQDENCNAMNTTVGACNLGIIDLTNYKWSKAGNSPAWNIKFTPKITWEFVESEKST